MANKVYKWTKGGYLVASNEARACQLANLKKGEFAHEYKFHGKTLVSEGYHAILTDLQIKRG